VDDAYNWEEDQREAAADFLGSAGADGAAAFPLAGTAQCHHPLLRRGVLDAAAELAMPRRVVLPWTVSDDELHTWVAPCIPCSVLCLPTGQSRSSDDSGVCLHVYDTKHL
jgi:hypothetical protein